MPHHFGRLALAGLTVATTVSPAAALTQGAWGVSPPLVSAAVGPDDLPFFLVGSVFLRDSVVYVADRGNARIVGLDWRSGEMLYDVGRVGEGLGEFTTFGLMWVDACGTDDRVFALDGTGMRLSIFSAELDLLRTVAIDPIALTPEESREAGSAISKALCLGTETLLATLFLIRPYIDHGYYRTDMRLGKYALESGDFQGMVGDPFPGDERYRQTLDDGERGSDFAYAWGKETFLADLPGEDFVIGTNDGPWLTRRDLEGGASTIRLDGFPQQPVVIPETEIRALHERELESARSLRADIPGIRRQQRRYRYPEHYPFYAALFLSEDGRLWVQQYPVPGMSGHRWHVVTGEGEPVATLEVPWTFQAMWADGRYVAGVTTDELNRNYVEVREIIRSS